MRLILGMCVCLQTDIPETSLEVAGTLQDYLPVFVELELDFVVDCSAIGVAKLANREEIALDVLEMCGVAGSRWKWKVESGSAIGLHLLTVRDANSLVSGLSLIHI